MTSTHSYYIRTSFYKFENDERVIETSFKIFVAEILLFKCLSKAFVIIWKILVKYSNATKLQKKMQCIGKFNPHCFPVDHYFATFGFETDSVD